MKILIVDDSRAMRRIVQRSIRKAGFGNLECLEAQNGREALDAVRRERPDLILSDWHMPEMTGPELKKELDALGLDIPFGFVTSEGTDEMRARARDAGAHFLLAKPFTPDEMAEVLAEVVA